VFFSYYSSLSQPELVTPAGERRSQWYGVSLTPTAFFDGREQAVQVTHPDSFLVVYRDQFTGARAHNTVIELRLDSATTTIDSQQVRIGVQIHPTDTTVDRMTNLSLVGIVYEDSVPYYSLLHGDTVHAPLVVRAVIADTWGVPIQLRFGTDFDTVLTTAVRGWNISHVGVAAFIQDTASKAVLQAVTRYRLID